jgi:teichuronic acid biosynthesis glycosyltransferase TuaC
MHLCLITSSYPNTPTDLALPYLPDFADACRARGHAVTVLTPDRRTPAPALAHPGVLFHHWLGRQRPVASLAAPTPSSLATTAHLLASAGAAASLLHARQPIDHVLAAFVLPAGLVALALRATQGVPYSTWALGSDLRLGARWPLRPLVAEALRRADHRFANSRAACARVEALAGRDCSLLLCARDLPTPAAVPVDRGRRNLLFLGRFEPVKGVDVLLAAFERTLPCQPGDVDLHLVGDGSLRAAVEAAARRPPLAGRLHVHPAAAPAEVAGYLAACDLLCLPSRDESLPAALIEAAAAGLPVLASAVGDVADLVATHALGQTLPPAAVDPLADALAAWSRSPWPRRPPVRLVGDLSPAAAADSFLRALT